MTIDDALRNRESYVEMVKEAQKAYTQENFRFFEAWTTYAHGIYMGWTPYQTHAFFKNLIDTFVGKDSPENVNLGSELVGDIKREWLERQTEFNKNGSAERIDYSVLIGPSTRPAQARSSARHRSLRTGKGSWNIVKPFLPALSWKDKKTWQRRRIS